MSLLVREIVVDVGCGLLSMLFLQPTATVNKPSGKMTTATKHTQQWQHVNE
jgi:hypothetical protein